MTISNIEFETPLYSKQEIEAVIKDGVKVEAILTRDFIFTFDWDDERWRFRIPQGFEFAPSIPAWARSFAPATGAAQWASIPHDYGYRFYSMPRADLDELYAKILATANEKGRYKRRQYLAVRLFGWLPWSKKGHEGEPTLKGLTKI